MIGLIFIELKFTPSPLAHCCDANGTTPSEENCQHYSIPFHFVVKKYQFRTAVKSRVVRRKCHLKDEDTFSLELIWNPSCCWPLALIWPSFSAINQKAEMIPIKLTNRPTKGRVRAGGGIEMTASYRSPTIYHTDTKDNNRQPEEISFNLSYYIYSYVDLER